MSNHLRRGAALRTALVPCCTVMALAAALVAPALAADQTAPAASPDTATAAPATPAAQPTTAPAGTAAMRVFKDAQTGRLRPPTPEEARQMGAQMRQMMSRSAEGLVERHHTDGSVSVDLEGRFMSVAIASAADGAVKLDCVDDARQAESLLTGEATANPATTPEGPRDDR